MIYITNGYLVKRIEDASNNPQDADHARAHGYATNFRAFEEKFYGEVHTQVDAGLAMDSASSALKDGSTPDIMTIHGCRHVSDLIENLDKIAQEIARKSGATSLSPLEAYILLCAAHVHDAGNIGGRKNHPNRSRELIKKYMHLFYDTESRQNIFDVARVHGGESARFGLDKLREIPSDNFTFPRLPLLAALLRMADELSENPERVPDALINWFKASPKSNSAYKYARSFRGFELQNDTLSLVLRAAPEQYASNDAEAPQAMTYFQHLEKKIDVIEREARYCSQYGRPDFNIRRIQVTVHFHEEDHPSPVSNTSVVTLELDRGYPNDLPLLSERCAELSDGVSLESYCRGQS